MKSKEKLQTLDEYFKKQMRNPRFREAWEQEKRDNELTRQLIRLRTEQGLTQEQVAEMIGTQQAAISRLEHHPPKRATELLKKVARLYGYAVKSRVVLVPPTT